MDTHDETQNPANHSGETPDNLDPQALRDCIGKARRGTTLRSVGFTVLAVSVLALTGFLVNNLVWTNRTADRLTFQLAQQLSLRNPDVYVGSYQYSQGFLGGTLTVGTFDLIDGTPIPGPTWQFRYSVFGGLSYPEAGNQSPAVHFGPRVFNDQTGQPIMKFYVPGVAYPQHLNDLAELNQIPSRDHVEVALSFNRAYSFKQVNAMLPGGIHPSWYWVDTYSASERPVKHPVPLTAATGKIFGFSRLVIPGPTALTQTPADFLAIVESGRKGPALWLEQDRQILQTLAKGKGKLKPSEVRFGGVVVTGTPATLKSLMGQSYISASSLGAMAPPF
jgi:hypothetical protein